MDLARQCAPGMATALLSAGNEPKLAELFARAELKRGGCGPAASASWVTDAENPKLRGAL